MVALKNWIPISAFLRLGWSIPIATFKKVKVRFFLLFAQSRDFDFEILTHFSLSFISLSLLTSSLIGSKIHTVAKTIATSILVSGHMMIRPKIDNDLNRNFKIVFSSFRLVPLTSNTKCLKILLKIFWRENSNKFNSIDYICILSKYICILVEYICI